MIARPLQRIAARAHFPQPSQHCRPISRRWLSSAAQDYLAKPVQSYISTSRDPYLNLSIEHHLLQKADPKSVVLFLYVNRPSIIIGRNQNPWAEVNLASLSPDGAESPPTRPHGLGKIDLVRRRSGGGTVFHDEGNVNWTVICPSAAFTRDKHAEMVVRALRKCGVDRSRVNARHDIVLDQGDRGQPTGADDTHATPYQLPDDDPKRPLKVSGSAYKLTRGRALHHATCLLSSPNVGEISHYLRSPAKKFLETRGVESVSSPVTNITLPNETFIAAVQTEFAKMYNEARHESPREDGQEWLEDESVRKGVEELKSVEWTFLQTPQFTLHNAPFKKHFGYLELVARNGVFQEVTLDIDLTRVSAKKLLSVDEIFLGRNAHEFHSWRQKLLPLISKDKKETLMTWLDRMLPKV